MDTLSQQRRDSIQPDVDQAQRNAVGFELRNVFALRPDHPRTPFDDMLDLLDSPRTDA
jgi:hypothetical protein